MISRAAAGRITYMDTQFLSEQFSSAVQYEKYLEGGKEDQQRRWKQVYEVARVTDSQRELLGGFVRQMNILVVSGIWCGDCVEQCPLIQRIAEANPDKIDLRFVERDQRPELRDKVAINGGHRVPAVLFLSEDYNWCASAGDRTIHRYRAVAMRKLGPSCPIGIVPPDKDELEATLADWCNEVERVQLMLRLTPRLREKYKD
jgi:thiol-disulfide isomerase/thioredoxin